MKKEDFTVWKNQPTTLWFFRMLQHNQKAQNDDLANGLFIRPTNDESMQRYNQIVGYNKALGDMQRIEFEELINELIVKEHNDDEEENE